jgi:multidrug efflux pump subunit AcrA (membrane-fusion protein)
MKLKSLIIGGAMVLCAGLAVFALNKGHKDSGGGEPDDAPVDEHVEPLITVQTGALTNLTLHHYINGFGTVEPAPASENQPAAGGTLAAPIAGVVARVAVIEGQQVKAGDVLVELNSGTASFNYAKAQVERQKKLLAEQNTSQKNLQDAEAQLASLQIISPISGTVTRISAKAGAAVDANAVVAEVIDLKRLCVSAQIPASDANELNPGQEVQVGSAVTTALSFVSPAVDAAGGTVSTRALLPPDSGLRPGQFVPLKIVTAVRTNCLAAPAESVITDEEGKSFIVLVNGEEASRVPVTAGLREGSWVEIEGKNLKPGATIVTMGAYGFPDKAKIRNASAARSEPGSTNSTAGAAASTNSTKEK